MNFRVGQKVVCVDDKPHYPDEPPPEIKEGGIYTVSNVFSVFVGSSERKPMVELVEIYQPGDDDWNPGFIAACFRPAVERKTDISIFTAMLTPSPERVRSRSRTNSRV